MSGVTVSGGRGRRVFGWAVLRVNGAIFAMLSQGQLVVKLPRCRVETLIEAGTGGPFDARKDTPMKEWLTVAGHDPATWQALAREAHDFVARAAR